MQGRTLDQLRQQQSLVTDLVSDLVGDVAGLRKFVVDEFLVRLLASLQPVAPVVDSAAGRLRLGPDWFCLQPSVFRSMRRGSREVIVALTCLWAYGCSEVTSVRHRVLFTIGAVALPAALTTRMFKLETVSSRVLSTFPALEASLDALPEFTPALACIQVLSQAACVRIQPSRLWSAGWCLTFTV